MRSVSPLAIRQELVEVLRIASHLVGLETEREEAASTDDEYALEIAKAVEALRRAAVHVERRSGSRPFLRTALTPRDREVARLLVQGMSYKEIAKALDIAVSTAQSRAKAIYGKLGVHSKRELAESLAGEDADA